MSYSFSFFLQIGIVGRTGAGKSSIIQSLFRMAELNGRILIDDIDTQQIPLYELRRHISIIPQVIKFCIDQKRV
jgi:ATP-binding cassette subfamily C (CFTR/MRP) protein 4